LGALNALKSTAASESRTEEQRQLYTKILEKPVPKLLTPGLGFALASVFMALVVTGTLSQNSMMCW